MTRDGDLLKIQQTSVHRVVAWIQSLSRATPKILKRERRCRSKHLLIVLIDGSWMSISNGLPKRWREEMLKLSVSPAKALRYVLPTPFSIRYIALTEQSTGKSWPSTIPSNLRLRSRMPNHRNTHQMIRSSTFTRN